MKTNPAEGWHQVINIKDMTWANAQQRPHTHGRQGIPDVMVTENRYQEPNSDPVADKKTPPPRDNMVRYHQNIGFLPRYIIQVPNQHSMGEKI